ncbi:MAG: SigE family RNA polymerase sigma factor [Actinomycetota bacterium]|nr:SigE family RNA polymerase sigma factor [Actinomycetota bacterium]MDQ2955922.1 SigE family RNA polymerase sigma factor [Actinomycetota bacterium]
MTVGTSEAGVDFDRLYRGQWHHMVRIAMLLVDDVESAKDCVQDAFLGVYRRPPSNPDAQLAYLRRAVVNAARSALRRRGTARRHLRSTQAVPVEPSDHRLMIGAEYASLMAALRELPRRQREVLVLRYWSELSEAEIADALGIRPGTVKSAASRALTALEAKLGDLR